MQWSQGTDKQRTSDSSLQKNSKGQFALKHYSFFQALQLIAKQQKRKKREFFSGLSGDTTQSSQLFSITSTSHYALMNCYRSATKNTQGLGLRRASSSNSPDSK